MLLFFSSLWNWNLSLDKADFLPSFLLQAKPTLPTFAVLSIPSVTRFADALVRFGSVLADGIDVAVVSPIDTFVNICK